MFFRVVSRSSPPSLSSLIATIHPLPLSFLSFLFECTTDGTDARSSSRGRRSCRCQRAPLRAEYPHLPCVPQEKKFTSAPSRHVLMRKCKGISKAAMKAGRSHAEIAVQYEHPDVQIYKHTVYIKRHHTYKKRCDCPITPARSF